MFVPSTTRLLTSLLCLICAWLCVPAVDAAPRAKAQLNESDRRAHERYNRLWHKVDQLYGQGGSAAPKLKGVKRGGGFAYTMGTEDASGYHPQRRVYGNPTYLRQLGSQKKSARNAARFTTLHEWGHLFGPKGTGPVGNEGLANRAANIATRFLNKQQAQRRKRKRPRMSR